MEGVNPHHVFCLKMHSGKLRYPLKIDDWKMRFPFKWYLFRGHVSFGGGVVF